MDATHARAVLSAVTLGATLAVGALVFAFGGVPAPSSAASVEPVLVTVTSNLTCSDFEPPGTDWNELTVDPNGDGIFIDDDGPLAVKISNTTADKTFDWESVGAISLVPPGVSVDAVYVKGGSGGSHLYVYDPESVGDTGLDSPGEGESNGISHISFCYDAEGETATPQGTTTRTASTGTPGTTTTPAVTTTPGSTQTAIASATSTPVPTDTPTPTATNTPTATPTKPAQTHTPTRTRTPDNDTTSTPEPTEVAGEDVTPISEVLGATPPAGPGVSGLPAAGDGWQEWRGGYGAIAFLGLTFALFGVCLYSFWRARQQP